MGIFNRSENNQPRDESTYGLPPDPHKIDAARAAHLKRVSHMPGPGVLMPAQSQRVQGWSENDVRKQEQETLEMGAAAEAAGQAAIEAAQAAPETVDPNRQLHA